MQTSRRELPEFADELLRPSQAARYVGISSAKLAKLRMALNRKNGPVFIKLGACVLYRRRDLEAWLDANTVNMNR